MKVKDIAIELLAMVSEDTLRSAYQSDARLSMYMQGQCYSFPCLSHAIWEERSFVRVNHIAAGVW